MRIGTDCISDRAWSFRIGFTQELRFNEIVTYEKLGDAAKAKELCEFFVQDYPWMRRDKGNFSSLRRNRLRTVKDNHYIL